MRALASVKSRPIFSLCGTGWLRNEEINLLSAERKWAAMSAASAKKRGTNAPELPPEVFKLLPCKGSALVAPSRGVGERVH
jgi:hypothetical protein